MEQALQMTVGINSEEKVLVKIKSEDGKENYMFAMDISEAGSFIASLLAAVKELKQRHAAKVDAAKGAKTHESKAGRF